VTAGSRFLRESLGRRVAPPAGSVIVCAGLAPRTTIARMVALDKAPAVLADRAEQILKTLGYTEPRGDTAQGMSSYGPYIPWIARTDDGPHRWDVLARERPPAFIYWYRTSPRPLIPWGRDRDVEGNNPPLNISEMTLQTGAVSRCRT
jgi:hypothetical protein